LKTPAIWSNDCNRPIQGDVAGKYASRKKPLEDAAQAEPAMRFFVEQICGYGITLIAQLKPLVARQISRVFRGAIVVRTNYELAGLPAMGVLPVFFKLSSARMKANRSERYRLSFLCDSLVSNPSAIPTSIFLKSLFISSSSCSFDSPLILDLRNYQTT